MLLKFRNVEFNAKTITQNNHPNPPVQLKSTARSATVLLPVNCSIVKTAGNMPF